MNPEILTVHSIEDQIEYAGLLPYANRLIQEINGEYFFVDVVQIDYADIEAFKGRGYTITSMPEDEESDHFPDFIFLAYKVCPVPLKVVHFIINVIKGTTSLVNTDFEGPAEKVGERKVYLMPGTEIFGHKVERVTEIPAELKPVVVEKL